MINDEKGEEDEKNERYSTPLLENDKIENNFQPENSKAYNYVGRYSAPIKFDKNNEENSFEDLEKLNRRPSLMNNFKKIFLDTPKKSKTFKKPNFDFFGFGKKRRRNKKYSISKADRSNSAIEEESLNDSTLLYLKKKSIIREILRLNDDNEWKEYREVIDKKILEEKNLKNKLKTVFNIRSDFVIIWKTTFAVFNTFIIFMFFFKYVLLTLPNIEDISQTPKRILYVYYIINIMFIADLIFSILIISFNGGSLGTYLKLPIKIYNIIPFPLTSKYLYFMIPKFFRIDLIGLLLKTIENFLSTNMSHYIQDYYLKIFIIYTNKTFSYLLQYGLFAHLMTCILSSINEINYISGLFYVIESYTTIGFGENSPSDNGSLIVMIINLFITLNFFAIMTCTINYLMAKIYDFSRETSFSQQFEFLIFKMQKSTGKLVPGNIKELLEFYLLFKRGVSYQDLRDEYDEVMNFCRNSINKEIHQKLFKFLKIEYNKCFLGCEKEYIYAIFQVLKPKIFKNNKIIIKYGQKVKYLYFLFSGGLFVYNKNGNPVYAITETGIFGDYEFISGNISDFIVKVHPKLPAYGFIIDKNDWIKISEKYISSAKNFIYCVMKKRKQHFEWLKYSYRNNDYIESSVIKKNENIRNDSRTKSLAKYNELIIEAKEKNSEYDIRNNVIFQNINDFQKKIGILELRMVNDKVKLFKSLS